MIVNKIWRRLYGRIDRFALRSDLQRRSEFANNRSLKLGQVELTKEEENRVKEIWGEKVCLIPFQAYKSFCGKFDPYYVPDDYYDYAEHVFNLRWAAFFLQHKSNLKLILPSENRAKVLLQKIDGHFVNEDNVEIVASEAKTILSNCPEFMAKVARGTGGGKGVQKIVWDNISDKESVLKEIMEPIDMEYEYVLRQNDFMSMFNPDSVNTIRFVTLNINGSCTVLSAFLRMGTKGSYVDNLSGGGGVLVGIGQDGFLSEFGVDKHFSKKFESPTGVAFKGVQIPNYEQIKSEIRGFHQRIPYANLIGWDVTLDETGNVIVIEVNLDSALVEAHQIFNGPIFGDRLEEVMTYIESRKPLLKHQMIIY